MICVLCMYVWRGLVDPKVPTSLHVPSSSISGVEQLQKRKTESAKRGQYLKLSDEQKAKIAQYAYKMEIPLLLGISVRL